MKAGNHEAWKLLPGDRLLNGQVVSDCTTCCLPGVVSVTFTDGSSSLLDRQALVTVNQ